MKELKQAIKLNSREILISRVKEGVFRYQAWPTVIKDENGVIYVAVSANRTGHVCPFGKNFLYVSNNGGLSYNNPIIINDTKLDDRDAGLTYLGNGKILLTFFKHPIQFYLDETEFLKRANKKETWNLVFSKIESWKSLPKEDTVYGSFTRLSADYGETWEKPYKVPVSSPHGPIKLKNGNLLFIGKEFHSFEYEKGAIFAFTSSDEGKTWNYLSKIPFPEGANADNIHEPWQLELENGDILAFLRGQGKEVPFEFTVYLSKSTDGGKTWSNPEGLGVCGSPPHAFIHSSGAIVLTYGRRAKPFGLRALISYDNGNTWSDEYVLDDTAPMEDLGYPSSIELDDGSIYTVYYKRQVGDDFPSLYAYIWNLPKGE